MEDRSRVAAATAAVVPFHCVICFEEFCLKQRLPVVLPCGHTYVCSPCSKRLKRCMECREPLFYTIPKTGNASRSHQPPPPPSMYGRGSGKYSPTPLTPTQSFSGPSQASPATTQIFFPIPKNVVLIAMMEAAERKGKEKESESQDDTNGSMNASDEEEQYDLNRIISGMATLSGPCGTYAVKKSEGLTLILPDLDPDLDLLNARTASDEPAIEIKEPSALKQGQTIQISLSGDSIEIKEHNALEQGQTVQVVSFDNGVAKLARGTGYIMADSSQLVKIGGPLEKSCRLEGLLDTVVNRGEDLQKELDENNKIEASLRREIEAELGVEPNHPVVTDAPRSEELSQASSIDSYEPLTPGTPGSVKKTDDCLQPFLRTPEASPDSEFMNGRPNVLRDFKNGVFPFSANSIDNADLSTPGLPRYRRTDSDCFEDMGYGCGVAFLGNIGGNGMLEGPRLRSQSSDGEHPGLGPSVSSSFDTVNFRTGMSGHSGLTNSNKNAGHSPTPRSRMRMSEHRGIARARGPQIPYTSSTSPT